MSLLHRHIYHPQLGVLYTTLHLVGMTYVLSELAMYCVIYRFLVAHDRRMASVLSQDVINSRIRKNVIDILGHATAFIAEIFFFVFNISVRQIWLPDNMMLLFRCYDISLDGIMSAIHICWSNPLR